MRKARVLIAEDYSFFRDILEQLLQDHPRVEVVGRADTKAQVIEDAALIEPDILIVDLGLLGREGLDAVCQVKTALPLTDIIVIGDEDGAEYGAAAQERGAAAYLVKGTMCHELVPTIDSLVAYRDQV